MRFFRQYSEIPALTIQYMSCCFVARTPTEGRRTIGWDAKSSLPRGSCGSIRSGMMVSTCGLTAWNDADHLVEAARLPGRPKEAPRDRRRGGRHAAAVEQIAAPYDIPVQSSRGFDSLTAKYGWQILSERPSAEVLTITIRAARRVRSLAEDVRTNNAARSPLPMASNPLRRLRRRFAVL